MKNSRVITAVHSWSFRRKPESKGFIPRSAWIPAFAGMTDPGDRSFAAQIQPLIFKGGHEGSEINIFEFFNCARDLCRKLRLGSRDPTPKRVTPRSVLIGGAVRIPPGFPLKACGNDGVVGELGVEGYAPFAFSVSKRKILSSLRAPDSKPTPASTTPPAV